MNKLSFRISSKLKDLIGRELITDDFIAVFELVKNSFDAYATKVDIIFDNNNINAPKIIIVDNGKGMSYKDIVDKWLFVAYSAKNEGSEDDDYNYRDKIKMRKFYAGAKGVGRFSADRLGQYLNLITKKNKSNSIIENIEINWNLFEEDAKKEFKTISVIHRQLKNTQYNLKHGTVLEILNLRSEWDRNKIKELKKSLSKLINPQIGNQKDKDDIFTIIIKSPKDEEKDKAYIEKCKREGKPIVDTEIVNGEIKNFVFETLNLKTTNIYSEISIDGKHIKTILTDRGKQIYEIVEKNNNATLHHLSISLFFLNKTAKLNFSKIMGVQPLNYGNIFVYKNGFRVYPYGQIKDDTLGLDARKAQGYSRFLGTRELIGRIEIFGINSGLKETTSRADGLIATPSYNLLKEFFFNTLKRLEKYVVETKEWGVDDEYLKDLTLPETKKRIVQLLANLTQDTSIISISYADDIVELFNEQQEDSVPKLIKNFKRIASESNDKKLSKKVDIFEKQFSRLKQAKEELEIDLDHTISENLFLRSVTTTKTKDVISLQHHIDRSTNRIQNIIDNLSNAINKNQPKNILNDYISKISFENKKISTISRFVTKANFNLKSETIEKDLVKFIIEYLENVYKYYDDLRINNKLLKLSIVNEAKPFNYKFRPLEIIIIIDNLIDNAQKNGSSRMLITLSTEGQSLIISFRDDGTGIKEAILPKIFNFGFTTTVDGSGIGLYHVKQIMHSLKGNVEVNNKLSRGVEFKLEFKQ